MADQLEEVSGSPSFFFGRAAFSVFWHVALVGINVSMLYLTALVLNAPSFYRSCIGTLASKLKCICCFGLALCVQSFVPLPSCFGLALCVQSLVPLPRKIRFSALPLFEEPSS